MNSGKQQTRRGLLGLADPEGKDFGKLLIFKYILNICLVHSVINKSLKNLKDTFDIKKI